LSRVPKPRAWAFAALLLPTVAAAADALVTRADQITQQIATTFVRSYPLIAASAGVAYRFDPVTGNFQREAAIAGQVFLERSSTIGRGRWNLGVSYQRVPLASIEGQDTDSLSDPIPLALVDDTGQVVGQATLDKLDVSAVTHVTTFSFTYGLTDDADVNLTLPLIASNTGVGVNATATNFLTGETRTSSTQDDEDDFGAGDLIVRGRYRFLERDAGSLGGGLVVRFPTGDVDRLRGTGEYEVMPALYASSRTWHAASWAQLSLHLNLGVDIVTGDLGQSEGRWGIGCDWGVTERATLGLAFLGRHPFEPPVEEGFYDLVRVLPGPRLGTAPLFGLTGDRPDYYDMSFGGRASVWRDMVIAFANVVVPLNDAGVRTGVIPLVGVEVAF
jgi:hypothetical protein